MKKLQNTILYSTKDIDFLNPKVIFWIPKKYIETLYLSTIPKLITFMNSDETTNIERYFNQNNPYKHLNYANEETYLISHKIDKNTVIENSIAHVINNIEEDELQELTQFFMPLIKTKRVKVMEANTENEQAVYLEIMSYIEYMQKIKLLLTKNKEDKGDKSGTGFRKSSLKKIVDTKINTLEQRLVDPHFPITNQEEIKLAIKILKKSQEDEYKNLFEYFHITNNFVGLDINALQISEIEKECLQQTMSFHNGITCSDIELVRSSIIFLNLFFFSKLNDDNEYIDSILNISTQFFNEELSEINKEKNQITFSKNHLEKPYALKTTLDKTSIFIYSTKESPMEELMDIAFKSMAGLENKFEPDKKYIEKLSDYRIMKNILTFLKYELKLDKYDRQVFNYFFSLLEQGKIPLPHFVQ